MIWTTILCGALAVPLHAQQHPALGAAGISAEAAVATPAPAPEPSAGPRIVQSMPRVTPTLQRSDESVRYQNGEGYHHRYHVEYILVVAVLVVLLVLLLERA